MLIIVFDLLLGHVHKMTLQQTPSLVPIIFQATAYRSERSRDVTNDFSDSFLTGTRTPISPNIHFQLPAGRHHQSSAPSSHSGRHERSRSRSPHRNHRDNRSSSHRNDRKVEPRAASPQRERYHRQRNHVSKYELFNH